MNSVPIRLFTRDGLCCETTMERYKVGRPWVYSYNRATGFSRRYQAFGYEDRYLTYREVRETFGIVEGSWRPQ